MSEISTIWTDFEVFYDGRCCFVRWVCPWEGLEKGMQQKTYFAERNFAPTWGKRPEYNLNKRKTKDIHGLIGYLRYRYKDVSLPDIQRASVRFSF